MSEQSETAFIQELRGKIDQLNQQLEEVKANQALNGWDDSAKPQRSLKQIKKGLANGELKYKS